jgi:hypothetical protein
MKTIYISGGETLDVHPRQVVSGLIGTCPTLSRSPYLEEAPKNQTLAKRLSFNWDI